MTMTHQHFQLIAETIAGLAVTEEDRWVAARAFADRLRSTNGAFDRGRFLGVAMGDQAR